MKNQKKIVALAPLEESVNISIRKKLPNKTKCFYAIHNNKNN